MGVLGWWILLCVLVVEVELSEDGTCEFRSVLRTTKRLRAEAIHSISRSSDEDGEWGLTIVYEGGEVGVADLSNDRDFIARLSRLNPSIKIEGPGVDGPALDRYERVRDMLEEARRLGGSGWR